MIPVGLQDFLKAQARAVDIAAQHGTSLNEAINMAVMEAEQKKVEKELRKKQELLASGLFTPAALQDIGAEGPAESALSLLMGMQKGARSKMGDIPRGEMPQVQAWQAKDDGVPMGKLEFVDPKVLKYSQKSINTTKAQGIANHWDTVGKEPVLISRDNWVLDGHHRVEAARIKNKWIRCYRVDLPGRTALNRLKEVEPQVEDPA